MFIQAGVSPSRTIHLRQSLRDITHSNECMGAQCMHGVGGRFARCMDAVIAAPKLHIFSSVFCLEGFV